MLAAAGSVLMNAMNSAIVECISELGFNLMVSVNGKGTVSYATVNSKSTYIYI